MLRISVSESDVSSNPGVSTKTAGRPSRRKGFVAWTVFVKDCSPSPIPKFDPLMRLMNCLNQRGPGGQKHNEPSRRSTAELKQNVR